MSPCAAFIGILKELYSGDSHSSRPSTLTATPTSRLFVIVLTAAAPSMTADSVNGRMEVRSTAYGTVHCAVLLAARDAAANSTYIGSLCCKAVDWHPMSLNHQVSF